MLAQLESPPEVAGKAVLTFSVGLGPRPICIGNRIQVPWSFDDVKFYPLLGGEQFLLVHDGTLTRLFFGGTDEAPFVAELDPSFLTADTEAEFYDRLKPHVIRELEAQFGGDNTRRQGDIFAHRLPCSWRDLRYVAGRERRYPRVLRPRKHTASLFGTRHTLTGPRALVQAVHLTHEDTPIVPHSATIGEGVLRAPDHADKTLEGVNVFAQTPGMIRPD